MVTITATGLPPFRFPTRQEMRAHMSNPRVLITVILCVTFLVSLFVAAIVFMAYKGLGTEALTVSVVVPVVGVMVSQISRLKALEQAVRDAPTIPTPEELK